MVEFNKSIIGSIRLPSENSGSPCTEAGERADILSRAVRFSEYGSAEMVGKFALSFPQSKAAPILTFLSRKHDDSPFKTRATVNLLEAETFPTLKDALEKAGLAWNTENIEMGVRVVEKGENGALFSSEAMVTREGAEMVMNFASPPQPKAKPPSEGEKESAVKLITEDLAGYSLECLSAIERRGGDISGMQTIRAETDEMMRWGQTQKEVCFTENGQTIRLTLNIQEITPLNCKS